MGPGDELVITLWGATQIRQTFVISREGTIYDDKVGLLSVTGKSMPDAIKYLRSQYSKVYATLNGVNPTTFLDVSLGKLKSININFVGEVNYPGIFPVHPFSTLITGLIQAGGVDTTGSLRSIQIKRNGKLHAVVDLYDYFLLGNLPNNIQLRDQDVIFIPVRMSTVKIDSAVYRPGIYESNLKESVFKMIEYAGGLTPEAINSIILERTIPIEKRNGSISKENSYLSHDETKSLMAQDGDIVTIRKSFKNENFVQLIGQVKAPGFYKYFDGMTFQDLLSLGGGLDDTTFVKSVYMSQAEIIRRNPKNRFEDIIIINLNEIMSSKSKKLYPLQSLDRVVVHANSNYFEKSNVKVVGEVSIPGDYPLLSDNETLQSIIFRTGGLTSQALKNGISIYRDKNYFDKPPDDKILTQIQQQNLSGISTTNKEEISKIKLGWQGMDVTLMPGDSIVIRSRTGSVFITGEIYNPGLVEFQKGKSLNYYINAAGGINNYGDKNNVVVVLPNGITVPKRKFRTINVQDGSTIVVYQKADLSPFDINQFASTTASLLSSFITIFVLYQQVSGN